MPPFRNWPRIRRGVPFMSRRLQKLAPADNLTSRSIKQIILLIRDGSFKRGEQLPPQDVMAKTLGVSRTALREALKELSYRGIIASRHGKGTFVCDTMIREEETLEARRILEPRTAALAAERADAQDLARLKALCAEMDGRVKSGDLEGFSELDHKFHCAIAEISRNRALAMLMASVGDTMLYQQNVVHLIPGAMERAYLFHLDIARAIVERQPDLAEKTMARHLDDVVMTLQASKYHNTGNK